jgi:cytochrome c-type biogenesis protein CcmF
MVLHPPALYLGFVGISVPASMAVAMLVVARVDAAWMALSRRWLLEAWSFLTLGILLGGLWSYEVLGWGGYWAWDPVENASLVPWLTLTACVHAALLAERRGRDLAWALVLAIASFLLVLLGTFMTRSGVFNSVHAFTQSSIGPIFLTFIGLCSLGSVLLCAARLEKLPQVAGTRSLALKEILLRVNVLVLLALAFTVLLGTLYPLGVEAVAGEKVSVGEPYFERMAAPLFVALLLLLVPGVLLPWASTRPFRVQRVVPAGLVALGALVLAGAKGTSPLPLLGIGAGAMAATLTLQGVLDLLRERLGREPPLRALLRGFQMHKRRIAAHLVHLGFALAALAIAAGAGRRVEKGLTLPLGQSVVVGDWSLGFEDVLARREPHRVVEAARFRVETGGREVGILEPSLNHYPTMRQPMGTPAVRMGLFGDLYLSLLSLDRDARSATFRVILEPFVSWIWVAGLVMVLGGLLSAWPRATPSRPEPRSGRGGVS